MCIERRRQSGISLVELVIFIVIVSVGLAGVLSVLNVTAKSSADPMIRKQALAIAEAILEEVMLQPFTWCDPDDDAAATARDAGACAVAEGIGVETVGGNTDTRPSNTYPFDNVSDYHNLSTTTNIAGGGAALYTATVTVAQSSLNGIAADASLLVTVSVVAGGETVEVQGYRSRYAPNSLP